MKRRIDLVVVLSMVLLLLSSVGCRKKMEITDLPPGVSERNVRAWYEATGYLAVISAASRAGTEAAVAIHTERPELFGSEEEYHRLLEVFGRIAQAEIHAARILQETPNNFNKSTADRIITDFDEVVAELQKAEAEIVGIKSEEAKQRVATTLATIRTAIQGMRLLLKAYGSA